MSKNYPAISMTRILLTLIVLVTCDADVWAVDSDKERIDFVRDVQPIFRSKCIECHGEKIAKSGLRLDVKQAAVNGGDSGKVIIPHQISKSLLFERISSRGDDKMPPEGEPLSAEHVELLQRWIEQGAVWPDGVDQARFIDKYDWWSLRSLSRPALPGRRFERQVGNDPANPNLKQGERNSGVKLSSPLPDEGPSGLRKRGIEHGVVTEVNTESLSPIDEFVLDRLKSLGLSQSPEADRRTLIRRLSFDLIGLPPTPEEVDAFVNDAAPKAYERLVDRLLDSLHYGERWARHWLDVVHYGDTHGYDKDKPRPNAWPYRDYVIRAFNSDKPYSQFVEEQIAGDILAPATEDGITATGFIATGPWDFIGHAEVPESKTDGMIARLLDRDDMVSNVCNTFLSLTVQCARCHNHKFDPVVQEDYYRLQADFAALDRADRAYDLDPLVGAKRAELTTRQKALKETKSRFDAKVAELGGDSLKDLDTQIEAASKPVAHPQSAQFGYHSQIEPSADRAKWVQVDLGESRRLTSIQIVGCHDDFNNIGAGFGFPVRFRIELCERDDFQVDVSLISDETQKDFANPGVKPLRFSAHGKSGRFLRVTATKLAPRSNDFIFALAELSAFDETGKKNLRLVPRSRHSIRSKRYRVGALRILSMDILTESPLRRTRCWPNLGNNVTIC